MIRKNKIERKNVKVADLSFVDLTKIEQMSRKKAELTGIVTKGFNERENEANKIKKSLSEERDIKKIAS